MRTLNGIHAGNQGYNDDLDAMLAIAGPTGCLTMLHTCLDLYPYIRARYPELLIHVRMYSEIGGGGHWNEIDPGWWANRCVDIIQQTQPGMLGDGFVLLSGANEQDLAVEGHPDAAGLGHDSVPLWLFEQIWDWQRAWLTATRARLAGSPVRLGTAPLAGGHEPAGTPPDYEYTLPGFAGVVDLADVLVAHAYARGAWGYTPDTDGYWQALRPLRPQGYREAVQGLPPVGGIPDPGGLAVQYPAKTCLLAEFGDGEHSDPALTDQTTAVFRSVYQSYAAAGGWVGITPFLWDSGPEHGFARIRQNWAFVQALQAMERFTAAAWPPQEADPMWDRNEVWDIVCRAAGSPGYNESNAFAPWLEANPTVDVGLFTSDVLGYNRADWPYLLQPTTMGVLLYQKDTGAIQFVKRANALPLA